jgi:hypothetical protein
MRVMTLALALAALGAAGTATAAPGKFVHPGDKNKDQRIDVAEWVAMGEDRAAFAKADKNGDGKLDGPEFVAAKHPELNALKDRAAKHGR